MQFSCIDACYKGKLLHDKHTSIPIKYCMNNCKLDLLYFEGQSFSKEIKKVALFIQNSIGLPHVSADPCQMLCVSISFIFMV